MRKPLVFAIDFDGTIVQNKWPKIGEINDDVVHLVRTIKDMGHYVIIWTCREGESLEEAKDFMEKNNVPYDTINENIEERVIEFGGDCRKIGADFYLDDKSFNPLLPNHIALLAKTAKNKRIAKKSGAV